MYHRRLKISKISLMIWLLAIEAHAKVHVPSCMQDAQCIALLARARTLSRAQETEGALRIYQAAYESTPDPGLLVNIGRMHQKLGHLEQAAENFRRYLGSSSAIDNDELRLKAQEWLTVVISQTHSAATPQSSGIPAYKFCSNVPEHSSLLPLASAQIRSDNRPGLTLKSLLLWTSCATVTGLALGLIIGLEIKLSQDKTSYLVFSF